MSATYVGFSTEQKSFSGLYDSMENKIIADLIVQYGKVVTNHGSESTQAKDFRLKYAKNKEFEKYANALDRLRLKLYRK